MGMCARNSEKCSQINNPRRAAPGKELFITPNRINSAMHARNVLMRHIASFEVFVCQLVAQSPVNLCFFPDFFLNLDCRVRKMRAISALCRLIGPSLLTYLRKSCFSETTKTNRRIGMLTLSFCHPDYLRTIFSLPRQEKRVRHQHCRC